MTASLSAPRATAVQALRDREKIVCLGMDAFRLCMGLPLRNHTPERVAEIIGRLAAARRAGAA